ncbi:hypothetical protein UlMin_042556 [Ulmus minor]
MAPRKYTKQQIHGNNDSGIRNNPQNGDPVGPIIGNLNNQLVNIKPLYERFRKQHPPVFEGSSDPLVADEWLRSIEDIFNFMRLNDHERNNRGRDNKQGRSGSNRHDKRKGNPAGGSNSNQNKKNKPNNQGSTYPTCPKCGKLHPGQCRLGTTLYYTCGKEGHYSRNCPKNTGSGAQPRNNNSQLLIEGPSPRTNARVFTMTKQEAEAEPSTVVSG